MIASWMAGVAFNNSPVAAVHALAYPVAATLGLSHGHSNSIMLAPVIKYNS